MSFDFSGKLFKVFDTEQIKETFRKREFVVEEQGTQYPNLVKFELIQDRCEVLDPFNEGDDVTVSFDLSGRQWNDKFFTNLKAWRVQPAGGGAPQGGGQNQGNYAQNSGGGGGGNPTTTVPAAEPAQFAGGSTKDDLPF